MLSNKYVMLLLSFAIWNNIVVGMVDDPTAKEMALQSKVDGLQIMVEEGDVNGIENFLQQQENQVFLNICVNKAVVTAIRQKKYPILRMLLKNYENQIKQENLSNAENLLKDHNPKINPLLRGRAVRDEKQSSINAQQEVEKMRELLAKVEKEEFEKRNELKEAAARKIQNVVRARASRIKLDKLRKQKKAEEELSQELEQKTAALKIQSAQRQRVARKELAELREQERTKRYEEEVERLLQEQHDAERTNQDEANSKQFAHDALRLAARLNSVPTQVSDGSSRKLVEDALRLAYTLKFDIVR